MKVRDRINLKRGSSGGSVLLLANPDGGCTVFVCGAVTFDWARGDITGRAWPCSVASGRDIRAAFDRLGNLTDLVVNRTYRHDLSTAELDALLEAVVGTARPVLVGRKTLHSDAVAHQ